MEFKNNWAFIQDGVCINMAYFESMEKVEEFRAICDDTGMYDYLVPEEPRFWIGNLYSDGVWSHPTPPGEQIIQEEGEAGE